VLISLDTLRADAVSGFGAPPDTTPNLAAFAAESVAFETAVAASHHTAPSHATMLTGFSPFVHGVAIGTQRKLWRIPDTLPTLPEVLRDAGYATVGFTDGVQLLPDNGFARGFDTYDHRTISLDGKLDDISAWLDEHGEQPFFMFAHTYRAHQPYRAPADLVRPLIADYDGVYKQATVEVSELTHSAVMGSGPDRDFTAYGKLSGKRAETDADKAFLHELYLAGVTGTDREFQRFLDVLDEHGVLERAIVVVTSDHGEAFFEHGLDSHYDVFDEVLRVPLIVRLPDGEGAGRRVAESMPSVNLVPTLLELVGAESEVRTEGRSVAGVLTGGSMQDEPAFAAWWASGDQWPSGAAARTQRYKRINAPRVKGAYPGYRAISPVAFFDIEADPTEQENRAAEGGSVFQRLGEALADAQRRWKALRRLYATEAGTAAPMSDEQAEALRAIGYMGEDR
jgi:arylsulfatase A-like enzyme